MVKVITAAKQKRNPNEKLTLQSHRSDETFAEDSIVERPPRFARLSYQYFCYPRRKYRRSDLA